MRSFLGLKRYFLAVLVLLSHTGWAVGGGNPGVLAVVMFYATSGYVMFHLVQRHYLPKAKTWRFYGDRLMRIYPQYAVYALSGLTWWLLVGRETLFLQHSPAWVDGINNLLIVPLNFFMFNQADRWTLVPPAWSLGAELCFYAMAPWLVRHWAWALRLAALSFLIQALTWWGFLHSDWWGYRLLPGVLWVFVLGMWVARQQLAGQVMGWGRMGRVHLTLSLLLIAMAVLAWQGRLMRPYHFEVLLGASLALVLLVHLTRLAATPHDAWSRWDQRLGNWSYGMFLNHFMLIWFMSWDETPMTWAQRGALVVASTLLSALTFHGLERPVLRCRRRWRGEAGQSPVGEN